MSPSPIHMDVWRARGFYHLNPRPQCKQPVSLDELCIFCNGSQGGVHIMAAGELATCLLSGASKNARLKPQRVSRLKRRKGKQETDRMLAGGFKCFLFSPFICGEMIQCDSYFSNGLKPPTRMMFPSWKIGEITFMIPWRPLWSDAEPLYGFVSEPMVILEESPISGIGSKQLDSHSCWAMEVFLTISKIGIALPFFLIVFDNTIIESF